MFEKQFELRYFEMNEHGEASPATVLTLLEETASDHCSFIDHSLYQLIKQNIGWVLISGMMKIDRYPRHKEIVTIRTWLSGYSEVKGIRENIIYDERGKIIGRGKGLWVFYDIKRKRPVKIFNDIKEKWSCYDEESIVHDITKKIKAIDKAEYIKEFHVNRNDIDMNHHVNNISYLKWVMESIPDDIIDNCYLHTIDGRFISEAKYEDTVMSYTGTDGSNNSFLHSIKVQSNNKVCATAKTFWKERK